MKVTLKPTISNTAVKEAVTIVDCITESHVQKAASQRFVIDDSDNEAVDVQMTS